MHSTSAVGIAVVVLIVGIYLLPVSHQEGDMDDRTDRLLQRTLHFGDPLPLRVRCNHPLLLTYTAKLWKTRRTLLE